MAVKKKETLQVNNYTVEKQVGQRPASNLYVAHNKSLNQTVFLEVLQKGVEEAPEFSTQFQQRIEKISQLRHDNIAAISETGVTSENKPYAAIEYVSGTTLTDMMAAYSAGADVLPVEQALLLVRQVADALATAHTAGIIHHDLRPKNIIIRDDRRPVLIDLGLPVLASSPLQEDGNTADLIDYASPEQAKGQPVSNQSNIYSLGVILYELLAGHRPYLATATPEQTAPQPELSYVPLEETKPDLTAETYRLVRNCLQPDPWNRFDTLGEMVAAIDVAIAAEEAVNQPPAIASDRTFLTYAIAGVLLLVMVIAGILLASGRDETSPQVQTTPLEAGTILTLQAKGTIEVIGPGSGSEFTTNDTVTFDWFWPTPLTANQEFAVHLLAEDEAFLLGTVIEPISGARYRLQLRGNEIANKAGAYQWQVILEDKAVDESLFVSDLHMLRLLVATPAPEATATAAGAVITNTAVITATAETAATLTATPTETLTATAESCTPTPPPGWVSYTIKLGDYLFPMALQTNTTVERLKEVNCLNTDTLSIGQVIYLPRPLATATAVPAPTNPPSSGQPPGPQPTSPPGPQPTSPPAPTSPPPTPTVPPP